MHAADVHRLAHCLQRCLPADNQLGAAAAVRLCCAPAFSSCGSPSCTICLLPAPLLAMPLSMVDISLTLCCLLAFLPLPSRPHEQRAGHPDVRPDSPLHTNPYEFRYLTEFQSHEPEFDYLKSLEIEEKINKVRWVQGRCTARTHMLLTTNDKTVKLWKVCRWLGAHKFRAAAAVGLDAAGRSLS